MKTAYKKYDKINILIKTSEVIVIYNDDYIKFEKTNQKNNLETNAGNAIPVRTSGTTRFRKSVGHAVKSVWWMPWH